MRSASTLHDRATPTTSRRARKTVKPSTNPRLPSTSPLSELVPGARSFRSPPFRASLSRGSPLLEECHGWLAERPRPASRPSAAPVARDRPLCFRIRERPSVRHGAPDDSLFIRSGGWGFHPVPAVSAANAALRVTPSRVYRTPSHCSLGNVAASTGASRHPRRCSSMVETIRALDARIEGRHIFHLREEEDCHRPEAPSAVVPPCGFRRLWNGVRMIEWKASRHSIDRAAIPRLSGMQSNRDATAGMARNSIRDTEVHGCPPIP